jgi:hypothetical protein
MRNKGSCLEFHGKEMITVGEYVFFAGLPDLISWRNFIEHQKRENKKDSSVRKRDKKVIGFSDRPDCLSEHPPSLYVQ